MNEKIMVRGEEREATGYMQLAADLARREWRRLVGEDEMEIEELHRLVDRVCDAIPLAFYEGMWVSGSNVSLTCAWDGSAAREELLGIRENQHGQSVVPNPTGHAPARSAAEGR